MKKNLASGQGVSYSIFGGNKLTQNDVVAIQNYANAIKSGINPTIAMKENLKGCSVAGLQYVKTACDAGTSTDEMVAGLKTIPKATNAASIGLKALSVAGNMLMMMGISLAISGIVKGLQALANAQENAIEKANEFIGKFEEQQNALKTNKASIDSISSDYEKLANGVDSLGRNISLNSDEYARYNEIVNQIADMFPQMVQGYTDEGNAIIAHKGNVEELTKAYKEQKKAAQDAIIVGSADVFKGYKAKVDYFAKDFIFEESGLSQMKELAEKLIAAQDESAIKDVLEEYQGSYTARDLLKKAGLDPGFLYYNVTNSGYFEKHMSTIKSALNIINSEIDAQAAKIKPIMQAYLEQSYNYQSLDEDVQDIVKQIVGQFDSEFFAQFDNETEMATWVTENIVNKFKNNEKISSEFQMMLGIQTQFNKGNITVSEYQEKLSAFLKTIEPLPDETEKYIKLLFGIQTNKDGTTTSDTDVMINNIMNKLSDEFDDKVGELEIGDLKIASEEIEINEGTLLSWDELIAKIEEFKNQNPDETISSLEELNKQLDSIQSAYKSVQSAIEEYNEQGYLSVDTYQSLLEIEPEYLQYLMDEEGNLRLGTEAMIANTSALIDNMAMKQIDSIVDSASALESSANGYNQETEAIEEATDALSAYVNEKVKALGLQLYNGEITQEQHDKALRMIEQSVTWANSAKDGLLKGEYGGGSDAKKATELLDAELEYLDKKIESGSINFKDYIADRLALIEDYYAKGKISADEYYKYLGEHYEAELDYMDKIASAAENYIDRKINGLQKEIDGLEAQNEALEGTLDKYDSVLNVVEQVYDTEIERLEGEKDLIQEKIDAINEEADANKKAKAIEEARYALQQAQSQRNKKVYTGSERGFVYTTDESAIRDAQDELQQLETERLVDELEKEKDAIDDVISSLEEYKDKWSEIPNAHQNALDAMAAQELLGADYQKLILSNRIEDIDAFKEQYISTQKEIDDNTSLIESYEQKIEYYEGLKEHWASLTETYDIQQEELLLKEEFGANFESTILDSRSSKLKEFNDEYCRLKQYQVTTAEKAAAAIIKAEQEAAKGANGTMPNGTQLEQYVPPVTTTTAYKEASNEKFSQKNPKKYHTGLDKGYVGASTVSDEERLRMFQSLGKVQLEYGEIPALLKKGELVMTPEQQENIAKNIQLLHTHSYINYNAIKMGSMNKNTTPVVQHITLTLPNVTNDSGYQRLQRELHQMQIDAIQIAHKQ